MQVWDTAGQESFKSITKIFYRGAHCVFFCFDITNSDSFDNMSQWQEEMLQQNGDEDVLMFLIGTKKDLEAERAVSYEKARAFQKEKGIHFYFETSAKSGEGVEDVFVTAAKMLYSDNKEKFEEIKQKIMDKKQIKKNRHTA